MYGVITLKNALVDPDSRQPYLILVCLARSSADSIGDSILSTNIKKIKLFVIKYRYGFLDFANEPEIC